MRGIAAVAAAAGAIMTVTAVQPARAHSQQWNLDLSGGVLRSALDQGTGTQSLAIGLRYDDVATGLRISAGLPTEQTEPLWAAAGGWRRFALRHRAFLGGVDLAGNALVTRGRAQQRDVIPGPLGPTRSPTGSGTNAHGSALAGQVMPVIGYEGVNFDIHARAGVSTYRAEFGGTSLTRTVRAADLQLTYAPTAAVAIMPVARYFVHDADPGMMYVGAAAVVAQGPVSVWGSAGRFVDGVADDVDPAAYAAGLMLRLQQRLSVQASVRRDGFDPLYMTPPQTAWSMGASLLIGGRAGPPPAPVPASYDDGRATITLPVSDAATAPSIAGDFNGWTPQPMQRAGDDWTYAVAVAPGVYNYAYVSADGTWFVPESVPGRRDDGMGGHVAVLVVE